MSDDVLLDKVHDPATSAAELAEIAGQRPDLHAAIAAHPNAYVELLNWLAAQGNPDVRAAVEARAAAARPVLPPAPGPGAPNWTPADGGQAYPASSVAPEGYPTAVPPKKSRTGLIIGLVVGGVVLLGIIGALIVGTVLVNAGNSVVDAANSAESSVLATPSDDAAATSEPPVSDEPSASAGGGADTVTAEFCAVADDLYTFSTGELDYTDKSVLNAIVKKYQALADAAPSRESRRAYQEYVDVLQGMIDGDPDASTDFSDALSDFSDAFSEDYLACQSL